MKVTLNWLKQYVEFDWTPEELAERLTMLGIEVEGVEILGAEFDGIVVAQILTSAPHPNADKLSVCRVADGQGERQIVCGAKNFKPGDKVPLILPGHSLPAAPGETAFTIKATKMRGVDSQGMLCSPKELGLANDASGLLILPPDAVVGQPLALHLGRGDPDVVYDLEITPNRPDLNSVIGIAREISALTGNALKVPAVEPAQSEPQPDSGGLVNVRIQDNELCPRYVARLIRGVHVGPSPGWLRDTLQKVGIRSINNVVDVTNYVMLEVGQPLHAFDFHLLARPQDTPPTIVVRPAADGEPFTTLDGVQHQLTPSHLLIADETKGIALAGIMGGQNTEIGDATQDVLLESAYFKPQNIRATSKQLDLRTESSYRFERGCDVAIVDWASRRAAQLILETAGGQVTGGAVDAYPNPPAPRQIQLRFARTDSLLGITLPPREQVAYLRKLELSPTGETETHASFGIPSFRVDLKREVDLIEEVGRLYGVDRIPSSPPRGTIGSNAFDSLHDDLAQVRLILTGLGLSEAQGQTLISTAAVEQLNPTGAESAFPNAPRLSNPLSSEMDRLRPSLLPGLLEALRHNRHHQVNDIGLFEIGRVFDESAGQLREQRRLALVLTGKRNLPSWSGEARDAKFDLFDLKGIVEDLFLRWGVYGSLWSRLESPRPFYLEAGAVRLGKQPLGEIGRLSPALAKTYDLRDAVLLAEFNLDLLLARRSAVRSFKTLPTFPAVRRDIALLVPEKTTHDEILAAVRKAKPAHLEQVELFDVFRGQGIPEGRKSLAYAFTYRNPEKTLTDGEVNASHDLIVSALKRIPESEIR